MSANDQRQADMERELKEAIEGMEEALDNANGACAKKVRRRTIKIRRAIRKIAEEPASE